MENRKTKLDKMDKIDKKVFAAAAVLAACTVFAPAAFAATSDPTAALSNFIDFLLTIVQMVGAIMVVWGIVQIGMSLQTHDASQRMTAMLFLAGGLIIAFAKQILSIIGISI